MGDAGYLGDGAYATVTHGMLEIFAHNGLAKTNQVFLGPHEVGRLLDYLQALGVIAPDTPVRSAEQ